MFDFRAATGGIGVNEEANALRQRAGHGNLAGVEERHDVPPVVLGGTGREGGIEIRCDGEQAADDIVRLKAVCFDERAQQLVRCRENLGRIIPGDGRRAADTLESGGGSGHGT